MSKLTDKEWVSLTRKLFPYMDKGLRAGQSYMNALRDVNPDVYYEISGTSNDPFYDDNKIILFMRFLNNENSKSRT